MKKGDGRRRKTFEERDEISKKRWKGKKGKEEGKMRRGRKDRMKEEGERRKETFKEREEISKKRYKGKKREEGKISREIKGRMKEEDERRKMSKERNRINRKIQREKKRL